jgi:pyrroloquinoline quinone biosynthesis protein B
VRVEILGSAAGGGFPQWNCNCRNCRALRAGNFRGKARTQTQVAIGGLSFWYLLNASPDLRLQIEGCAALHPKVDGRGSPIAGVILTGADVDQIAGLLSLRELQPFTVYCTSSVRRILREDNSAFRMLNRAKDQVAWIEIASGANFLLPPDIHCETFPVGCRYPAYVVEKRAAELVPEEASLGLIVESPSGGRLAYLPAVSAVDDALLERLQDVDVLLFDGTFWSDDELVRVQGSGSTAREMGHIPVSSPEGSLKKMARLKRPRKIFIHINNTNPMLDESGPEYSQVRDAGWEVAEDGWGFEL